MSDDDDDLFGSDDGGDTDDLIAETNTTTNAITKKPPAAVKKKPKRLQKKVAPTKVIPDADNDDEDGGLFDDSDDEDAKKPKAKQPQPMSKRERMEALQQKKRAAEPKKISSNKKEKKPAPSPSEKDYESGDSYDSDSNFQRTKEDNDFIDVDGDDEDAINELYSEQHFDDERPDGSDDDEDGGHRSKKRKVGEYSNRRKSPDAVSDDENGEGEPENPIMAAVHKMKKKKREQKKLGDLEEEAKEFISKMEHCADEDLEAIKVKRPATKKLAFLPAVVEMLTRRDMMRLLLDMDVLAACKRWIQPLPNGTLGNVTVRNRIIETVTAMSGDQGIVAHDLKRSDFGKVVMGLYMHPQETPTLKRQLKKLIERWSRPIFQKSGNMKDLEHVHGSRGGQGLAAMNRAHHAAAAAMASTSTSNTKRSAQQDLNSLIASGAKGTHEKALNRVRVPFSTGFQYTVRPQNKTGTVADKRMIKPGPPKDTRGHLSKRMTEKTRVVAKNQRSANISVEGRVVK